ncbi:MAG: c-type cytochrome [Chloroflexota bacterium]|nr:c-type cytochrome [Chloroflexota bacterium]
MRTRSTLLATIIGVAVLVAACGRATEEEINQALRITPTPTRSAEEIATGTAAAEVAAATRTAEAAMAGSPGAAVALGDVTRGKTQFNTWCLNCHRAGGTAPNVLEAGGPGASLTYEQLLPLIRTGENHTPPGPYQTFTLNDKAVADITAFIRAEAGG